MECIQAAPTFQTSHVTVTVIVVDMNRDGTPDVLQQPQVGYSAPTLDAQIRLKFPFSVQGSFVLPETFSIDKFLRARLGDVASAHGGNVRLRSRLFAQRLHYTFPRECLFPDKPGTVVTSGIDEFNGYAEEWEMTVVVASSDHRVRGKTPCILVRASKLQLRGGMSRR